MVTERGADGVGVVDRTVAPADGAGVVERSVVLRGAVGVLGVVERVPGYTVGLVRVLGADGVAWKREVGAAVGRELTLPEVVAAGAMPDEAEPLRVDGANRSVPGGRVAEVMADFPAEDPAGVVVRRVVMPCAPTYSGR